MLLNIEAIEDFAAQLRAAAIAGDAAAAARCIVKLSSRRAARELAGAAPESIAAILKAIDPVKAGRVAGHLPATRLAEVIDAIPLKQAIALLSLIPPDHVGSLLRTLPRKKRRTLLAKIEPAMRAEWEAMYDYVQDTVGAAMTTEFLAIPQEATVAQALEAIASAPPEIEKSTYVYVIDLPWFEYAVPGGFDQLMMEMYGQDLGYCFRPGRNLQAEGAATPGGRRDRYRAAPERMVLSQTCQINGRLPGSMRKERPAPSSTGFLHLI